LDKHIAFITYETPFAPGGGIAAVMAYLPRAIQSVSQIPTFVITPFHINNKKTYLLESEMDSVGRVQIEFNSTPIQFEIKIFQDEISWVFLKPDEMESSTYPFFSGRRHPYDVPATDTSGLSILLRDSLIFGKTASLALRELCPTSNWTILLQDWEAATFAISDAVSPDHKKNKNTYLTLHNSYDSGLNPEIMAASGLENLPHPGSTVLESVLPLVQDPIFTVSDQFALDLTQEPAQAKIMIPHIVDKLGPRLKGVNNGPFINRQIPDDVFQAGIEGDLKPLAAWKKERRKQAMKIIRNFTPTEDEPVWGDNRAFGSLELPWFVMAGRDDTRQKGYEVACLAIDNYLEHDGQACFIFLPIPGDEGLRGLEFIHQMAKKYPARVICFPFMFREAYLPIMQGASFGMMPSYYEPFGMANEFFLNGVSCIGRATGGIIQQIVPYQDSNAFNKAVARKAKRWHKSGSRPSGYLFREDEEISNLIDDWEAINAADYSTINSGENRLDNRKRLSLVRSYLKVDLLLARTELGRWVEKEIPSQHLEENSLLCTGGRGLIGSLLRR